MNNNELVEEMSERVAAIMRAEAGNHVIPRFNQPKTIACVKAEFTVHEDIPDEFKQGVFARPSSYPATIRFANATSMDDSKKDLRGMSIRLSGVDGPVLWGQPGYQDFILNSYPALFVGTPEDFLEFIKARQANRTFLFFLNPFALHLKSLLIVLKARKRHNSPLDVRYWSTVPFNLGEPGGLAVKYSAIPISEFKTGTTVNPGENQLRYGLQAHLQKGPGKFHFAVQKQADPERMPIEDASVIWDEATSPFQPVATISIEDQDFINPDALAACERCSFNPWQCLPAHQPLGRMNEVRREVYARAAKLRNEET